MDINALYEAIYGAGRAPGAQDLRYWSELGDKAPAQETAQASLGGAESAFQQMLGRGMQDGAIQHLFPIDQKQGMQGVRSHIAGSDEYLGRMLNNPGQTNADVPAWQQAARQSTMHQAQMPGSFWDYSNPLLSNPDEAAGIMGIQGSQGGSGPLAGLLDQLLGTAAKKKEPQKKPSTQQSAPPDPTQTKAAFDQARAEYKAAWEKAYIQGGGPGAVAAAQKAEAKMLAAEKAHKATLAAAAKPAVSPQQPQPTAKATAKSKPASTVSPGKGLPPDNQPRQRSRQEMDRIGAGLSHTTAHLTPQHKAAIGAFLGEGYSEINAEVRSGKSSKHAQTIAALNDAFAKTPPLKEPVTTYRGINLSEGDFQKFKAQLMTAHKSGGAIELQGFSSTSLDIKTANQFSATGPGRAIVMEISARHGMYTDTLSEYEEREFTLPHKAKLKVVGIKEVPLGNGKTQRVLQMEQVV